MKVLYHYTCRKWLDSILENGYLKLSESNLTDWRKHRFDEVAYNNGTMQLYKPVVWLTEDEEVTVENTGLNSSLDKTEIRIAVKKQPYFKKWKKWSKENNINKEWAAILERGKNASSWWICETRIKLEDSVVKIENTKTGEVYFENEKYKDKI